MLLKWVCSWWYVGDAGHAEHAWCGVAVPEEQYGVTPLHCPAVHACAPCTALHGEAIQRYCSACAACRRCRGCWCVGACMHPGAVLHAPSLRMHVHSCFICGVVPTGREVIECTQIARKC
jgi:hypothetical protein